MILSSSTFRLLPTVLLMTAAVVVVAMSVGFSDGFVPIATTLPVVTTPKSTAASRYLYNVLSATTQSVSSSSFTPILLGKPTPQARAINAYQVMTKYSVLTAQGESVALKDLLSSSTTSTTKTLTKARSSDVSIVVFLRSLG